MPRYRRTVTSCGLPGQGQRGAEIGYAGGDVVRAVHGIEHEGVFRTATGRDHSFAYLLGYDPCRDPFVRDGRIQLRFRHHVDLTGHVARSRAHYFGKVQVPGRIGKRGRPHSFSQAGHQSQVIHGLLRTSPVSLRLPRFPASSGGVSQSMVTSGFSGGS